MRETIKKYYSLTKPGVLYGNVLTTVAGFLFASQGSIHFLLFITTVIGSTLVIASACVLNNYLDRDIDSIMERTKNRAIASGKVKGLNAVIFSVLLGIFGLIILYYFTNLLVVGIGIIGFIDYVWFYGALSKRMSVHGTLVGSISGAMPILAGYVAATNRIDAGAIILFLVLFFWQMPEFYSIAIYRRDEYKAAGIPVISVIKGTKQTKTQIFIYTLAFVLATVFLTVLGYAGWMYLLVMLASGIYWLNLSIKGLRTTNDNVWARKMFRFSLIMLLLFCFMISLDGLLPLP